MKTKKEIRDEIKADQDKTKEYLKAQNTPTPLKVGGTMEMCGDQMRRIDGPDGLLVALVSDKNLIDTTLRDNDAERFVRAVNEYDSLKRKADSHEALLELLKTIRRENWSLDKEWMLDQIDKAIAQAEGK